MVDNTVNISDGCVGVDSPTLIIKNDVKETNFNPRNLLPANVADGGKSLNALTGLAPSGATLTPSTGNGLRVVTWGTSNYEGVFTSPKLNLAPNKTYTSSVVLKGSGSVMFKIFEYDSSDVLVGVTNTSRITLTNTPTKYSITRAFTTGTKAVLWINTDNQTNISDFYANEWQLEEGNTASAWMPGNLLTYNQQTVETDLTGLTSYSGQSQQTKTRDTSEFYKGIASAKTVSNYNGSQYVNLLAISIPVKSGKTYIASIKSKTNVSKSGVIKIDWQNSRGLFISQTALSVSIPTNWTNFNLVGVAPANAAYAVLYIQANGMNLNDSLYWDEAWLIEYPTDNIGIKNQLSIPEIQGNLLKYNASNGGDTLNSTTHMGSNKFSGIRDLSDKYSGTGSFKVTATEYYSTNIYFYVNEPLKPNTTYTVSFWAKTNGGSGLWPVVYHNDANGNSLGTTNGVYGRSVVFNEWTKIIHTFTTPPMTHKSYIGVNNQIQSGESMWYDSGQLEEGNTATEWKYPSVGIVSETPSVKPKVTLIDTPKNILSPNVADCTNTLKNIEGFFKFRGNEVLTSDSNIFYKWGRSLKIVTLGNANYEGASFQRMLDLDTNYTISSKIKAENGVVVELTIIPSGLTTLRFEIIGNGDWQDLVGSFTNQNFGNCAAYIRSKKQLATTIYIGQIQIEEGSVATEWEYPGAIDTPNIKNTLTTQDINTDVIEIPNTQSKINLLDMPKNLIYHRNAATCTDFLGDTTGFNPNFGAIIVSSTEKTYDGSKVLKVTTNPELFSGCGTYFGPISNPFKILPGTFTVQARVWIPLGKQINFWLGGFQAPIIVTGTGDWQLITRTRTIPAPPNQDPWVYFRSRTFETFSFYIDNIQVEPGDVATEFVLPGGEDTITSKTSFLLGDSIISAEAFSIKNFLGVNEIAQWTDQLTVKLFKETTDQTTATDNVSINMTVVTTDEGISEESIALFTSLTVAEEGEGTSTIILHPLIMFGDFTLEFEKPYDMELEFEKE